MANRFNLPRITALDSNGDPISGAKLNFYDSGTTTRLDTYSDTALSSANANPLVADSAGRFGEIFLQASDYKVVLTDADDVTIWTADPVAGTIDVTGDDYVPSQQSIADMTVLVAGGSLFDAVSKTLVTNAAQTSPLITAPSSNPRKDIVYIDRLTGVVGVETGAEAADPADPTIADDKLPVARVTLATTTTEITDSLIDDIRRLGLLGSGGYAVKDPAVLAKAISYTVVIADDGKLIDVDASGGARTITLPPVADAGDGFLLGVKKTDSSLNAVTVDGDGSETIDGAATRTLDRQYSIEFYRCDGSAWHVETTTQKVAVYDFIDSTDTSITGVTGTAGTLVSSSQPIMLPTKGFIILIPHARVDNASGSNRQYTFGLNIDGTDYWASIDADGTEHYLESRNIGTAEYVVFKGVLSYITNSNAVALFLLDIEGHGISTGAQTVQPFVSTSNATATQTLKGTTVTARFKVIVFDIS